MTHDNGQNESITAVPPMSRPTLPQPAAIGPQKRRPSLLIFFLTCLLLIVVTGVGVFVPALLFAGDEAQLATIVFVAVMVVSLIIVLAPFLFRTAGKWWRSLCFVAIGFGSVAGWGFLAILLLGKLFVIPTGAMATTLLGVHKQVTCPQCQHVFLVNASSEADLAFPAPVAGCACPNCFFDIDFQRERMQLPLNSGDRIAVTKFLSDAGRRGVQRYQVIVFDHPPSVAEGLPKHYVFRLVGLPGETLAIRYGRLYVSNELSYDGRLNPMDLWQPEHMHKDDDKAHELFDQGRFTVLRKPPELVLALRQLVHDNDRQPTDLSGIVPPRWAPEGWQAQDNGRSFSHSGDSKEIDWLRYRHILRPDDWPRAGEGQKEIIQQIKQRPHRPELITDFMGYNSDPIVRPHANQPHWVGDLMLECRLTVRRAEGELFVELSKGVDRFRAAFSLSTGRCALSRRDADGQWRELGTAQTRVQQAAEFRLRFANVDERLILWVDDDLPFGDGLSYDSPKTHGPTENDLDPVRIGSKRAAVELRSLQIWRDIYYTAGHFRDDAILRDRSEPAKWEPLRNLTPTTFYVQPGHYFVLGDNSQQSSDSRSWGVVPERFLFGRARLVYAPGSRAGWIK